MTIISKDIDKAVAILSREQLVAIPTETVYGLAGNIFSEQAIHAIFNVKQRPFFNPLIVHIHSIAQLDELVEEIPDQARQLMDRFWPGSLTLILKKKDIIPDLITAGKPTVGLRMPNHAVTQMLLKKLPFPLAAPSANPFNRISPTSAKHVEDYFKDQIEMVLDGGECSKGLESTIIGFEGENAVLYRLGSISVEEIEATIGPIRINNKKAVDPNAPGMLAKHYSPTTKTVLVDDIEAFIQRHAEKKIGVISFDQPIEVTDRLIVEVLSTNGDLEEAASKLYKVLHQLDQLDLDIIVAGKFPNEGLGQSINDRLERASK